MELNSEHAMRQSNVEIPWGADYIPLEPYLQPDDEGVRETQVQLNCVRKLF